MANITTRNPGESPVPKLSNSPRSRVGPFGARLSESPISLRVWLTAGQGAALDWPAASANNILSLKHGSLSVNFGRLQCTLWRYSITRAVSAKPR